MMDLDPQKLVLEICSCRDKLSTIMNASLHLLLSKSTCTAARLWWLCKLDITTVQVGVTSVSGTTLCTFCVQYNINIVYMCRLVTRTW